MVTRAGSQAGAAHVLKVYDDGLDLVRSVTGFIAEGITAGEQVIVVATPAHRDAFAPASRSVGVDLDAAAGGGRYLALDARATLSSFMVDGAPDPTRFAHEMRGLMVVAAAPRVRIFGEMAAILWDDGNVDDAIAVESLWNDLGATLPFTLSCAHSMSAFARADLRMVREICERHTEVVAPESYAAQAVPSEPGDERSVAEVFMPVPLAVRAVRRFVERTVRAWGFGELLGDATVVASELATNAVVHARSPFRLSLSRDARTVRIAVADAVDGTVRPGDPTLDAAGGRGLAVVAGLSQRWGTGLASGGKVVWAELDADAANRSLVAR